MIIALIHQFKEKIQKINQSILLKGVRSIKIKSFLRTTVLKIDKTMYSLKVTQEMNQIGVTIQTQ